MAIIPLKTPTRSFWLKKKEPINVVKIDLKFNTVINRLFIIIICVTITIQTCSCVTVIQTTVNVFANLCIFPLSPNQRTRRAWRRWTTSCPTVAVLVSAQALSWPSSRWRFSCTTLCWVTVGSWPSLISLSPTPTSTSPKACRSKSGQLHQLHDRYRDIAAQMVVLSKWTRDATKEKTPESLTELCGHRGIVFGAQQEWVTFCIHCAGLIYTVAVWKYAGRRSPFTNHKYKPIRDFFFFLSLFQLQYFHAFLSFLLYN